MTELKKRKILVTGGAGFIGSNLVEKLLQKKAMVIVFDNLSTGRKENIKNFLNKPNFRFIKGDLRDQKAVERVVKKVDFIFHQAAVPSVARSILDPKTSFDSNVIGTINLFNAAKKYGIKKIVYASSSSIYGLTKTLPKKEEMPPNPISPYALSKYTGEKLSQIFSKIFGLPTVCLRYFNVFGPKQNPHSEYAAVIPKFIFALLNNESPVIYGDGKQTRDFTYVENVVEANLKAFYSKFNKGEIFNIACGQPISLLKFFDKLNEIFSKNIKPRFAKERPGDIRHSFADISKAKKMLDYHPKISFEGGLKKTINWFLENQT